MLGEQLLRLQAHRRREIRRQVVLLGATALATGYCAALVSAHLGGMFLARVLLTLPAAGAIIWAVVVLRREARGTQAGARLAETLATELGSAARTAVELEALLAAGLGQFSEGLAKAHIESTTTRLGELQLVTRLRNQQRRPHRRAAGALLASLAVAGLCTAALHRGRVRLLALVSSQTGALDSDLPLTTDVRVTYRYPAYTGLAPRVVDGGDGSLAALAGTEATIEATADASVRSGTLELVDAADAPAGSVAVTVVGERQLKASLVMARDGGYRVALLLRSGERLRERRAHPLQIVPDAVPEVTIEEPTEDVELRDDRQLSIRWRATDDFGVGAVSLVIEPSGGAEPRKLVLAPESAAEKERAGTYQWMLDAATLGDEESARIYVEAWDNNTVNGPQRGISATRTITLFSARRQHERLLEDQRRALDQLVDLLALELTTPPWIDPSTAAARTSALAAQMRLVTTMQQTGVQLATLVAALAQDELAGAAVSAAYQNVLDHVRSAAHDRAAALDLLRGGGSAARTKLATLRQRDLERLEQDVIYLDDLLALERIDALKQTAKDLLAAQRELQDLLERYRQTGDSAARNELERRIRELRAKMMQLLARMSEIKQRLPGEYRNLEAATMMRLDEQVRRLEQLLGEGDLEGAAAELQSLANMVENMVGSLDEAQQEYGGERYAEMRKQLDEFAERFRQLEGEQQALTKRNEELLREYRNEALKKSGSSLPSLIERVRREVTRALESNDRTAGQAAGRLLGSELAELRERLLDMQALLEQRDLSEARTMGTDARGRADSIERLLAQGARGAVRPTFERAARQHRRTTDAVERANELLDKVFPEASAVLSPEQMAKLRALGNKQRELRGQAEELGAKMEGLAEELPLFGGSPRESLEKAENDMGEAALALGDGELSPALSHERRALEALGALRQALQQAARQGGGKGGMPLPLALGGHGRDGRGDMSREEVAIPQTDAQRANPAFRQKLLEAAKQRPPERYEDMVRRYYEELIR